MKSRSSSWARGSASLLLRIGISADQISVAGMFFSALGGWALIAAPHCPWLFLAAAACVQLRLICNLLDGLVAVEGGRKSPYGPLFNEVPDRVEDSIFLICLGYAAGFGWLGFTAALLAAVTAYIRTLGGTFGLPQDFSGPMAKQQRMAAVTIGSIAALIESHFAHSDWSLLVTLIVISLGTAVTIVRRLVRIARELRGRA